MKRVSELPRYPHGGFARQDGSCILDVMHPRVQCSVCPPASELVCPCGTCRAEHRARTGHILELAAGGPIKP